MSLSFRSDFRRRRGGRSLWLNHGWLNWLGRRGPPIMKKYSKHQPTAMPTPQARNIKVPTDALRIVTIHLVPKEQKN